MEVLTPGGLTRIAPDFLHSMKVVRSESAHAEPGGNDRWRMPTYVLYVRDVARQCVVGITGCRFDRPSETIQRALRLSS